MKMQWVIQKEGRYAGRLAVAFRIRDGKVEITFPDNHSVSVWLKTVRLAKPEEILTGLDLTGSQAQTAPELINPERAAVFFRVLQRARTDRRCYTGFKTKPPESVIAGVTLSQNVSLSDAEIAWVARELVKKVRG